MNTFRLHQTELQLSRVALGCMNIGGRWDQEPVNDGDRASAEAAINTALECGIHVFDHADIYMFGKSEKVFGEWLNKNKHLRDRIVIQSKCGIRFADPARPYAVKRYDFSREHITRSVNESLDRLQAGHLDILLLHRPDVLMEPEEVARAFDDLYASGKVRYFGVSNHTPAQIELLRKYVRLPVMVNQIELSLAHLGLFDEGIMANRGVGDFASYSGTIDYCRKNDILIQAWSPLAHGKLTGVRDQSNPLYNVSSLIAKMAGEKQVSEEAVVLAWLLRHPAKIQPVVGTTRPERIKRCAEADRIELTREEWYALFVAARGGDVP